MGETTPPEELKQIAGSFDDLQQAQPEGLKGQAEDEANINFLSHRERHKKKNPSENLKKREKSEAEKEFREYFDTHSETLTDLNTVKKLLETGELEFKTGDSNGKMFLGRIIEKLITEPMGYQGMTEVEPTKPSLVEVIYILHDKLKKISINLEEIPKSQKVAKKYYGSALGFIQRNLEKAGVYNSPALGKIKDYRDGKVIQSAVDTLNELLKKLK